MRRFNSLIAGFVLLLPASARAQSVNVANLVGTWMAEGSDLVLIIRPDSTFRFLGEPGGMKGRYRYYKGHDFRKDSTFQPWKYLKAGRIPKGSTISIDDTISFGYEDGPCAAGVDPCIRRVPYIITVSGQWLGLRPVGNSAPLGVDEGNYYRAPVASTPQTRKLVADLVGTWEGTWRTAPWGESPCTLVFRPDSTFSRCGDRYFQEWKYLVGDTLAFDGQEGGFQVTLQDQQLTLTNVTQSNSKGGTFRRVDTPKPKP